MRVLMLLLFFLFVFAPALAWEARVVSVQDGDTLTVVTRHNQQVRIRLYGVDAPERKQPFGYRSRQATIQAVLGKNVEVQPVDADPRIVAVVSTMDGDGDTLNAILVRAGLAWVYPYFCNIEEICAPLRAAETEAKARRIGLWKDKDPVPPWEWRRRK